MAAPQFYHIDVSVFKQVDAAVFIDRCSMNLLFCIFPSLYAGTIYKGQGRTLDQTYLYHSEHWRSAPGYVALTRHRDKTEIFVAKNTAEDIRHLSRQMGRIDDRRAASHFRQLGEPVPQQPLDLRETRAEARE